MPALHRRVRPVRPAPGRRDDRQIGDQAPGDNRLVACGSDQGANLRIVQDPDVDVGGSEAVVAAHGRRRLTS